MSRGHPSAAEEQARHELATAAASQHPLIVVPEHGGKRRDRRVWKPGVRQPLVRPPAEPMAEADPETRLVAEMEEGWDRLDVLALVGALEQLAETATDRRHLQAYASDVIADEPIEGATRKWLHDWRERHAARLAELRAVYRKITSA